MLLVYSRIEGGRVPVHRQEVKLDQILHDACSSLAARAESAGITVCVDPHPVIALVDPVRIRQAVENIVGNALAHTPPGGWIRASAIREHSTVRLTVEDTGAGFDPGFIPRVFEPFARGAPRTPETSQGWGSAWPSCRQSPTRTAVTPR